MQAIDFGRVITRLLEAAPDDAELSSIGIERTDSHCVIEVVTRHPGQWIGRRGTTADAIRQSLTEALDCPVHLNIREPDAAPPPRWPPFDPPPDAPSPVR